MALETVEACTSLKEYLSVYTALIAGSVALVTSVVSSFVGPLLLDRRRAKNDEEAIWGPSKAILKEMLDNAAPGKGRSFNTLKRVTGLPDDQLHRLLIGIGGRGFTRDNGEEAWCYKHERPLKKQKA